jgi:hypothetical protein
VLSEGWANQLGKGLLDCRRNKVRRRNGSLLAAELRPNFPFSSKTMNGRMAAFLESRDPPTCL